MKKLAMVMTFLLVLAIAGIGEAAAHFTAKLGRSDKIVCTEGKVSVKLIIANDGDTPGTLTGIRVSRVSLYADGDYWWEAYNRNLGDMAYYLNPGESRTILVTFRDREISRFDGPMKLSWSRTLEFHNN